ncbi:MAG: grasp-with-spasm system ATP-grasp peptide maturase [Saprospiraceae bacterium]|nr:grasp-with-spasm system ATP-grasp peptide maturase [Candidatus Defluviibacterium haderslevense]
MVLIISQNEDSIINPILRYLVYFKIKFIRITEDTKVCLEQIELNNLITDFRLSIYNPTLKKIIFLNYSEIKFVWHRRGYFNIERNFQFEEDYLRKYFQEEYSYLNNFIKYKFSLIPHLNKQSDERINKLAVLDKAKVIGLLIPDTLISKNINCINDFIYLNESIITKAINSGAIYKNENMTIGCGTIKITTKDINENSESLSLLSLFQKNVIKKFDIRIFYINKQFFASAILSQKNPKTRIDFREYDSQTPNRIIPIQLPNEIVVKLSTLMHELNINSGSIDMIYSESNQFIFLEVNPVGQFEQVYIPCNYNIDIYIASLIKSKYEGI